MTALPLCVTVSIPERCKGQPAGRHSAFYALSIQHVIKWAVTGWRGFCLAFFDYTLFPSLKDERDSVVLRGLKGERGSLALWLRVAQWVEFY
jgi:hypothetical protein